MTSPRLTQTARTEVRHVLERAGLPDDPARFVELVKDAVRVRRDRYHVRPRCPRDGHRYLLDGPPPLQPAAPLCQRALHSRLGYPDLEAMIPLASLLVPVGIFLIALSLADVCLTVLHVQAESPFSNRVSPACSCARPA